MIPVILQKLFLLKKKTKYDTKADSGRVPRGSTGRGFPRHNQVTRRLTDGASIDPRKYNGRPPCPIIHPIPVMVQGPTASQ